VKGSAVLRLLAPWKRRTAGAGTAVPAAPPRSRNVPPDLMAKVRRIEIATNQLVDQGVAGNYHSVFKGRGMEFSEVRPYQPGDDVRTIDWNVTARMGQPFVKQFVEERDLSIFLAVDVSGSLSFGSRTILKRELAAELAALLAFAAVRNQDRVGAALISDRLELFLPLERPASGRTDLGRGLSAVLASLKRRSVLFVISDFLDAPPERALKAAAARHDVILLEIVDPHDQDLPQAGPVVLEDAETGQIGFVSGRKLARDHAARRLRERAGLAQLARGLGIDHLEIRTDRPYLPTLLAFFRQRVRRFGR
jgi:uncharacterized protein (DUF58 family)